MQFFDPQVKLAQFEHTKKAYTAEINFETSILIFLRTFFVEMLLCQTDNFRHQYNVRLSDEGCFCPRTKARIMRVSVRSFIHQSHLD